MTLSKLALAALLVFIAATQPQLAAAQDEAPLTNDQVATMAKAGLSDGAIITLIQNSKTRFDTSPQALVKLRQAGVSNAIIERMLAPGAPAAAPIAPIPNQAPALALPTAYGYYVVDNGVLRALSPQSVKTVVGLRPRTSGRNQPGAAVDGFVGDPTFGVEGDDPTFITFQQSLDSGQFHLAPLQWVAKMQAYSFNLTNTPAEYFPMGYGINASDLIDVGLWRPQREVPLRVEPVGQNAQMFRLIPNIRLSPGRYALWYRDQLHGGDMIFADMESRVSSAFYFGYKLRAESTDVALTDSTTLDDLMAAHDSGKSFHKTEVLVAADFETVWAAALDELNGGFLQIKNEVATADKKRGFIITVPAYNQDANDDIKWIYLIRAVRRSDSQTSLEAACIRHRRFLGGGDWRPAIDEGDGRARKLVTESKESAEKSFAKSGPRAGVLDTSSSSWADIGGNWGGTIKDVKSDETWDCHLALLPSTGGGYQATYHDSGAKCDYNLESRQAEPRGLRFDTTGGTALGCRAMKGKMWILVSPQGNDQLELLMFTSAKDTKPAYRALLSKLP